MNLSPLGLTAAKVPAAVPARRADVSASELLAACRAAADQGARLVALWATDDRDLGRGFRLCTLLADADGLLLLQHRLPNDDARYPDLAGFFPAALIASMRSSLEAPLWKRSRSPYAGAAPARRGVDAMARPTAAAPVARRKSLRSVIRWHRSCW